jgi:hypothetical protein
MLPVGALTLLLTSAVAVDVPETGNVTFWA